jgi:signal peptidase I
MKNLKTKIAKTPFYDNNNEQFLYFIYYGLSMLPTFIPGQYLYVKKEVENISIGDVIVFETNGTKEYTVHRVISIIGSKIFTRGDHNSTIDKKPVDSERIIGRVESIIENGQLKKFTNGDYELIRVRSRWILLIIKQLVKKPFRPIYQYVKHTLLNSKFIQKKFSENLQKVIVKSQDGGELIKFLYKGNAVAKWWPEQDQFFCKKPFDLIIPRPDIKNHIIKYNG